MCTIPGRNVPRGETSASLHPQRKQNPPEHEGIETQSTNSNQLSVHSIHSRFSLPGAGIMGLECKIDFRTPGSVLEVSRGGSAR